MVLGTAALAASAALIFPTAAQAAAPAPATVAKKLFNAWLHNDKVAAAKVATPAAVSSIFAYVFRAPDVFAGCKGNFCRFKHTSVNVPGDLDGIGMVVTGGKVTKVYRSRHATKPATVAQYLLKAWTKNDRNMGLEVAKKDAVCTDSKGKEGQYCLFRAKYDPNGVKYLWQGCTKEPKGYSCAYSYEGGALLMHVRGSKARGYEVAFVSAIAD